MDAEELKWWTEKQVSLFALPRDQYKLKLTGYFAVTQPTQPNWWHRWWQKMLLGWVWEKL